MGVYTIPDDRKYWVIRADGGKYYDHFIENNIVALGHLDELNLEESTEEPYEPHYELIEQRLDKLHESQNYDRGRTTTHIKQVRAFLSEIQVGDWVVTIGNLYVRFGRITGLPRLSKVPLEIRDDNNPRNKSHLKYNLRRSVIWGPSIRRSSLPYGLLTSLRANQTLFNIDHHVEAVYHSLYPVFIKGGNLYLSARINTEDKVKNYSFVSLLSFLNEIEVIAKEFDNQISVENFDKVFNEYALGDRLTITTEAAFHSPGEIWNTILTEGINLDSWITYAVISYSMIFGNKMFGLDGLLDLQTRQKLWELVIDRMKKKNISSVVETLELTAPTAKTKRLESDKNDELVEKKDT